MKTIFKTLIILLILSSCGASEYPDVPVSHLEIVNLIKNDSGVYVRFKPEGISLDSTNNIHGSLKIKSDESKGFSLISNVNSYIELLSLKDTATTIYSESLNLDKGIYWLYLFGDTLTSESILIKENRKQLINQDSTLSIGFVNLSEKTEYVNVRVVFDDCIFSEPEGCIKYPQVSYKSGTEFELFPVQQLKFLFEDEEGQIIKTFNFNPLDGEKKPINRNVTLVLRTKDSPFGTYHDIKRINHY